MLTIFGISEPIFLPFLSIFERYQRIIIVAFSKKHRQFNIKPKYQNATDEGQEQDIQSKWHELKQSRTRKKSILTSPWYMILFLIAVLVLWYYLSGYE